VVTIVLKPLSPDYKRWHDLVLLTLCRYALDDQVLSDVVDPSIYWARLDSIVVTWILGTLSPELHEIVREPTEIARQAWLVIEAQFLGNSESRVLQLDARFHAFKQDDLSVSDHCRRMKDMADNLYALGETVIDRHPVLNLLQGLNKRRSSSSGCSRSPPSTPSAMTSSSRRSSWTTRWPRDRLPRSTLHPQEEGALRSSCCLHARLRRN
jgi:hypothetical protein